jgi:tRNA(fMet)-specific endonuclease VapC
VSLWVLDTDHLSLLERGNVSIRNRLQPMMTGAVAITIVTAEEKLKGRLATINGLTRNRRDFERVPGLSIENWSV